MAREIMGALLWTFILGSLVYSVGILNTAILMILLFIFVISKL